MFKIEERDKNNKRNTEQNKAKQDKYRNQKIEIGKIAACLRFKCTHYQI